MGPVKTSVIRIRAKNIDFCMLCHTVRVVVFRGIERVKEKLRKAWQGNIPCRALRSFRPTRLCSCYTPDTPPPWCMVVSPASSQACLRRRPAISPYNRRPPCGRASTGTRTPYSLTLSAVSRMTHPPAPERDDPGTDAAQRVDLDDYILLRFGFLDGAGFTFSTYTHATAEMNVTPPMPSETSSVRRCNHKNSGRGADDAIPPSLRCFLTSRLFGSGLGQAKNAKMPRHYLRT